MRVKDEKEQQHDEWIRRFYTTHLEEPRPSLPNIVATREALLQRLGIAALRRV